MTTTIVHLNKAQCAAIYAVIGEKMSPDDRDPREVIDDPNGPYFGDEEMYLRAMAQYHRVDLEALADSTRVAT